MVRYIQSEKGYFYKILNNKKIRISKNEYDLSCKNGGSKNNSNSPTDNRSGSPFSFLTIDTYLNNNNTKIKREVTEKLESYKYPELKKIAIHIYKNLHLLNNQNYNKNNENNSEGNNRSTKRMKINKYPEIRYKNIIKQYTNNNTKVENRLKNSYSRNGGKTKTIIFKKNELIIKKFDFSITSTKFYLDCINEIIMHIYAYKLTQDYNLTNPSFKFKVPKIEELEIIKYDTNNLNDIPYITINIKMEFIPKKVDISDEMISVDIYNKIQNYLDYLRENGVYHNDTHNENLFFINDGEYKIALIDYGKANTNSIYPSKSGIKQMKNKSNNNKIKHLRNWAKINNLTNNKYNNKYNNNYY